MLGRLAAVFTILSVLGVGGGNTIFPQMFHDAVEYYHWITAAEFSRDFALARLAPGPGVTICALIGYAVAGMPGAVVATIAMFLPAALIVYVLAYVWERFHEHPWRTIFARSMLPIVLGLSWVGVALLARGALDVPLTYVIAAATTALLLATRVNTSLIILAAGALGAAFLR